MCGHTTLHHTISEVAARFAAQLVLFEAPLRYNIVPSQPMAVITHFQGQRSVEGYRWGLVPSWAKDASIGNRMINARSETLLEKPSFKAAFRRRRCLIPADGYFEWPRDAQPAGKKEPRQPVHVRVGDGELFAFAGLWEEWIGPDGSPLRSCAIVTTEPNETLAPIHHRMPVILRPEWEETWLDHKRGDDVAGLEEMFKPYPIEGLEVFPVTPKVNKPVYDAPDCIEPFEHKPEQLSLL